LILELIDCGVLLAGGKTVPALAHDWRSYAAPSVHVAMLADATRTSAFVEAVRAALRPGDIVVDVGTGTGVLALAAAQAGAAHVYAIERSSIGSTAAAVFERAGVADRVTLFRGHSTQIELPERADLLISELVGDEPLDERILEVTADAIARFLKPNATAIPKRIRVFSQAVTIADEIIERHVFDERRVEEWKVQYGLNLSGVLDALPDTASRFFAEPAAAAAWQVLTAPVELVAVDLRSPMVDVDRTVTTSVIASGRLDGAVVFFELDVDDTRCITTQPGRANADCHWLCPVWALPRCEEVSAGEALTFRYQHGPSRTTLAMARP
jgi:hypothetical protein